MSETEDLRVKIASIAKQLLVAAASKESAERSALFIEEAAAAARAGLTHHKRNYIHMKYTADVVNLKEFGQTKIHVDAMQKSLDAALIDLNETRSRIANADAFIEIQTKILAKSKNELANFGQIIDFPWCLNDSQKC